MLALALHQDTISEAPEDCKVVEGTTLRVQCTQKLGQAVEVTAVVATKIEMETTAQTIPTRTTLLSLMGEAGAVVTTVE